jgi:hypothetical protein
MGWHSDCPRCRFAPGTGRLACAAHSLEGIAPARPLTPLERSRMRAAARRGIRDSRAQLTRAAQR